MDGVIYGDCDIMGFASNRSELWEQAMKRVFGILPGMGFVSIFLLAVLTAVTAFPGTALAATWVVDDDGGPGVDFTDLPPAIAAASAGDVIVVRDGQYSEFTLSKGLSIVADTGHAPAFKKYGDLTIAGIPKGDTAVLSGFGPAIYNAILIENCEGHVVVDDCSFEGSSSFPGIQVLHCDLVTLCRVQVEASDPFMWHMWPFPEAARFEDTNVIVSECIFEGGDGADAWCDDALPGSTAVSAMNCQLFFQSSSALGGSGGLVYGFEPYGYGGDGAPGIELTASYLELFGLTEHCIEGGYGGSGYTADGDDANAILSQGATIAYSGITLKTYGGKQPFGGGAFITQLKPAVPVIVMTGSGELGGHIRPALHGPASADYALFASPFRSVLELGGTYAHLLLKPGFLLFIGAGTINPVGPPTFLLQIPPVPAWQGIPIHFQALVVTGGGQQYLSTSASFTVR